MILIDANLLLYAYNAKDPRHDRARDWVQRQLAGTEPVCLCWPVVNAFIRIGTNPRAFERPMTLDEAIERVTSWLGQPCVRLIVETAEHWDVLADLLRRGQATGNLVTDAHLAALAIEHGCELNSTDADFARFPKLRWRNPLA